MSSAISTMQRVEQLTDDRLEVRDRGAFFTPREMAEFLAEWAIDERPHATVLDPTCGDGSFLEAAGRRLSALNHGTVHPGQLIGVDIDEPSLASAGARLANHGVSARLARRDFLTISSPDGLLGEVEKVDAVVGNPPYVRYQKFSGPSRTAGLTAALKHGVRLSGLSSSWAPILVHAASFLKDDGRLAMVLPGELLTVGYAEPIRRWLLGRFERVKLVLFERLQFHDAQEDVILLLATGVGGCDAFSLYYVQGAADLTNIRRFDEHAVGVSADGKWSDLLLPLSQRQLFQRVAAASFVPLGTIARVELGTVTGHNAFFTLTEATREAYGLVPNSDVHPVVPPGTGNLIGTRFSRADWVRMRQEGYPVWLLAPTTPTPSAGLRAYLETGRMLGVPDTYKCRSRSIWWRPPMIQPPDMLFTYMSHRYPRLIANTANATVLNSMHGIRLNAGSPSWMSGTLPLASLNSLTMLGGELRGRAYGGGVLKMEPREAASLPIPDARVLAEVRSRIVHRRSALTRQLAAGRWTSVLAAIDRTLFIDVLGLSHREAAGLHDAARTLRARRLGRTWED